MLAAGLKGLLTLDEKQRGSPLLLNRAVMARVVYPDGAVHMVEHVGASLPREVFERASFALDRRLGDVERSARRTLRDLVDVAFFGKPPRA